jgi:hypothetical protein
MLGKSLDPAVSHKKTSRIQSEALAVEQILFPKTYEDEWELADISSSSTDFDKARFFMVRFANMAADQILGSEVLDIASNPYDPTVLGLASAVKTKVFTTRHATFATTPLLQCMRFILIKSRVTDAMCSDRAKPVVDFFFDPTIARNLDPLSRHTVAYTRRTCFQPLSCFSLLKNELLSF